MPATLMYDQAFLYSKFGYGSSIGVVILMLALMITFGLNHVLDEKDEVRKTHKKRRGAV